MRIPDVNNYRLLSEHGKVLLAAQEDGEQGLHFVTWEYSYNRTGVNHEHYSTDYEGTKRDFAVRSGLFSEKWFLPRKNCRKYTLLLFFGVKTMKN